MKSVHEAARPPNAVWHPDTVRPPVTGWHFRIGQCVSRKDRALPFLVTARVETRNGLQIYSVRSFAATEERRDRRIIGGYLRDVALGSVPCQVCLLHNTCACPAT